MFLLLHGALGSSAQFDALSGVLPAGRMAVAIDLPGHGAQPADGPFSLPLFADAVLHFLDKNTAAQADFFGYSMGGYLALWLAWKYPERVRRVVTYGTKLDWNPEVAAGMARMFDPEKIAAKAPQLAESLAKTHGKAHWQNLCRQTADFLHDLGQGHGLSPEAFEEIACPVSIGWGELDNVVSREESEQTASRIPNGRFEILPGGKHLLEQVDAAQIADYILRQL